MQVALIADIHGNAVALDAVLAEIDALAPDRVVCLGDVASGPQPVAAHERIEALGCPVVRGNHDAGLLDFASFDPHRATAAEDDLRRVREMNRWAADQLDADQLAAVREYEPTVRVELGGGADLLCYHGSPRSHSHRLRATTSDETLDDWFAGVEAAVLAGAHTHVPLVRRFGDGLVLNPGSVGASLRDPRAADIRSGPWAEYAVVELEDGRLSVDLRRTAFDADAFVAAIRASGMPDVDWYAERWQLDAPLLANGTAG